jgi:hypothetical protein
LVASSIERDADDETTPQETSTDIADTLEIDEDDLYDLADYFDVSPGAHVVDLDVNNPPTP